MKARQGRAVLRVELLAAADVRLDDFQRRSRFALRPPPLEICRELLRRSKHFFIAHQLIMGEALFRLRHCPHHEL